MPRLDNRVKVVQELFKGRYNELDFINKAKTKELIKMLLKNGAVEKIFLSCLSGQPPLLSVIEDVEKFATKNKLDQDIFDTEGKIRDTWKQNVGMLIGAIAFFMGFVREEKIDLQKTPDYFHYASTFKKETTRRGRKRQ